LNSSLLDSKTSLCPTHPAPAAAPSPNFLSGELGGEGARSGVVDPQLFVVLDARKKDRLMNVKYVFLCMVFKSWCYKLFITNSKKI
jgi:hypothetical protein